MRAQVRKNTREQRRRLSDHRQIMGHIVDRHHVAGRRIAFIGGVGQTHPRRERPMAKHGRNQGRDDHIGSLTIGAKTVIGIQNRFRFEEVEQRMVETRVMVILVQHFSGNAIVERYFMRPRTEHHAERHIRRHRHKLLFFIDQPRGFLRHRLGQGVAGLREVAGHLTCGGGKIAKVARGFRIQFLFNVRMRPRGQSTRQPLHRLGEVFVKQIPNPRHQPQKAKTANDLCKEETILFALTAQPQPRAKNPQPAEGHEHKEQQNPKTQM